MNCITSIFKSHLLLKVEITWIDPLEHFASEGVEPVKARWAIPFCTGSGLPSTPLPAPCPGSETLHLEAGGQHHMADNHHQEAQLVSH